MTVIESVFFQLLQQQLEEGCTNGGIETFFDAEEWKRYKAAGGEFGLYACVQLGWAIKERKYATE